MSLTRKLARRVPLAATLGLAASLGFLPATASAIATYAAEAITNEITLDVAEDWEILLQTIIVTTTTTNTGNTTIIPVGQTGTSGSADAPGGELERSVVRTVSITVTNNAATGISNTLLVEYELIADAVATAIGEQASANAGITLDGLGPPLLAASVTSPGMENLFAEGELELDFELAMGGSRIFTLIASADGRAFAPANALPAPEPGTLSLLGLGLLAAGYARRRRRS